VTLDNLAFCPLSVRTKPQTIASSSFACHLQVLFHSRRHLFYYLFSQLDGQPSRLPCRRMFIDHHSCSGTSRFSIRPINDTLSCLRK
jgi:hypothetical protein